MDAVTPERIAADRIARAIYAEDGGKNFDALPAGARGFYDRYGAAGVEAMSAGSLVILTAERVTAMLDALRLAHECIAGERASVVECDTLPDADGRPDESTMDELTREAVAAMDQVLGAIGAVIGEGAAVEQPA